MSEVIILNRIYTGDYLEEGENIGHEALNIFKPESKEGDYYLYLMQDGSFPLERARDEVKAVYMTKGISADCVEVLSCATGIEPVFKPRYGFAKLQGYADAEGQDAKPSGHDSERLEALFIRGLCDERLDEAERLTGIDLGELRDWIVTPRFQKMKPFGEDRVSELSGKAEELYILAERLLKMSAKWRGYRLDVLAKAINRRAAHIEQLVYIIENNICLGGVRIDRLFSHNTSEKYGIAIYITYRAKQNLKPRVPTYIVSGNGDSGLPSGVNIIRVSRGRIAATSLASYFHSEGRLTTDRANVYGDDGKPRRVRNSRGRLVTETRPLTEDELREAICKERENYTRLLCAIPVEVGEDKSRTGDPVTSYQPIQLDEDFTFLRLIGKEYDELSYSNMFAYFFTHEKYRELFKSFMSEKGVKLGDSFTILRESFHIDLLVLDRDKLIVIENKVKSGINGVVDKESGKRDNQLERYRQEVMAAYPDKTPYFFVFSPDYNYFSPDELAGYTPVTYSELYSHFSAGLEYEADGATKVYFADFLKALKLNSVKNDNRHREIMRSRLQRKLGLVGDLNMKHSYTTSLTANNTEFLKTCTAIEGNVKGIEKKKLLVDVDGSMIQTYIANGKVIKVFDDYEIDAVYVDSEIDLTGIVNSKIK